VWLIGAMVCLLAAPWVRLSVSACNGWPRNALRHHCLMPVSCHFRDCKSAAGHESDSCKRRYNKCPDLYLYLYQYTGEQRTLHFQGWIQIVCGPEVVLWPLRALLTDIHLLLMYVGLGILLIYKFSRFTQIAASQNCRRGC